MVKLNHARNRHVPVGQNNVNEGPMHEYRSRIENKRRFRFWAVRAVVRVRARPNPKGNVHVGHLKMTPQHSL